MTHFASPADTALHGTYQVSQKPEDPRPLLRFDGRVGSGEFPASAGRYHLYSGWFCPSAQRSTAVLALAGIDPSVVSVSYVHGERDGRGWAFREPTGGDPVNGFTLLRQAYEVTEAGFDGHVSTPTLWDREARRVVSNTYAHIDVDLATAFVASSGRDLYPEPLRARIDEAEAWLHPALNQGVGAARAATPEGEAARTRLAETLAALDDQLSRSAYLIGDELTLADVRVIVTLLRYDAQANADGTGGGRLRPTLICGTTHERSTRSPVWARPHGSSPSRPPEQCCPTGSGDPSAARGRWPSVTEVRRRTWP